jgi:tight adherence protein C
MGRATSLALVFGAFGVGTAIVVAVARRRATRRRARARTLAGSASEGPITVAVADEDAALARWLALAGFRDPRAVHRFALVTVCAVFLGLGTAMAVSKLGLFDTAIQWVEEVPGNLGDLFVPILYAAPWIVGLLVASVPFVRVRAARRARVEQVEQDMPITLELLATLGEAGLGFDASIDRLIGSMPQVRPLAAEFRMFQAEMLAGLSRVQCFRRFARRLAVGSVSIFVSALVQAEQVGSGFADVLRRQADDLRNRRRERATMLSQALPVKLVFPLVICFLPGIFVSTLGPAFHSFFRLAENYSPNRR